MTPSDSAFAPDEAAVTSGSDNVFDDLGLPQAEDRLLKAQIAVQIRRLIESRGLTQTQAAEVTGVPQSNISHILSGRLKGYSVERLLSLVNRLGCHVEVRITPAHGTSEAPRTVVTVG